jgi:protein required for attachment to host cells
VFSSTRRGLFRSVPLDAPVPAELVYDRSPYLVPLLAAALRRREYLAVHTDSHRARLYAATPGGGRLIEELDAEVPRKQHSAGERWGLGQATIARHHDEAVHHYVKELAHRLERAWAGGAYAGLLLFGPPPTLEHVRKALPARLRARVERETPEAWSDRPAEVEAAVREATLRVCAQDEARGLEGLWDRLATGRAVAIGPAAALDALQGGQLQPGGHGYLVLGPDPRETVGRCTRCHALVIDAPPACPRCQRACRLASLWEEVLLMALRHGVAVRFVDDPEKLAPYGGIVAALPKDRPLELAREPARQAAEA